MSKRHIPCSRSLFATQSDYEECLDQRREQRRGGSSVSERLDRGFALMNQDDDGEADIDIDED